MADIIQRLNGIPFRLKAAFDFGFLQKYGTVFRVFDDQDSGNICFGRLSNTIRTRLSRRLMRPAFLSFIDGRQPICFIQDCLNASSILRRSKISEPRGRSETRHRFADGLSPFKKR